MPRRIQDYPYGYSAWHSFATLGHMIVLLGVLNFLLVLTHAAFFKRPLSPRAHGFPFISTRLSALVLDKHLAAAARLSTQTAGLRQIRRYIFQQS